MMEVVERHRRLIKVRAALAAAQAHRGIGVIAVYPRSGVGEG